VLRALRRVERQLRDAELVGARLGGVQEPSTDAALQEIGVDGD
jgi:hypothetical protein